ncbi:murein hydrolase activator EnvC family protein [Sinomicrobium weinanense]|uniref:Peptidoglycan DD-metalloendopeptidase family protein n=1 Tax=Sinomicrobium weinanense TaxID=2842200 RepID=A0A926PZT9_9FLAO|nr:peptidoglycan DD-metalloendopeptidase family protein [Sinomicrobium weinanense]MBC9794333.1 peptidoglycan DD-metalloendopeptidase family protein [Sinomicrobium weinanense]MBU3124240.1 peptidoglycan DD-metalloendopeptidase family protein [Sinomicrobium weinanense]
MTRERIFLLLMTLLFCSFANAQNREQKELEAKRARLQEEIRQINTLLSQQKKERQNVVTEVEDLNQKIRVRQELIQVTNRQANLLNRQVNNNMKKIADLRKELGTLKEDYAGTIRRSYKGKSRQNRLMFLLSSESFFQAYKRLQYMKQYADYRKEQGRSIEAKTIELQELNKGLIAQRKEKEVLIGENKKEQQALEKERQEQQALIASIRKKESKYNSQITKKRRETKAIDRQIEKLIREAIAESNKKAGKSSSNATFALTPEAKVIANNFSANKGKLIWPVEKGVKSKGYGEYSDPVYPAVKNFNNGVIISTQRGEKARAVFDGEVSAIIAVPGANKAVQLRHGNYITTYYNLGKIYVKKGQKVSAKTQLGEIFTSPSTGKTELKFFLYRDTNRLNPEQWIYRM